MSFFANLRMLTKIVAVVVTLSGIAAGITWLGVSSLKSLSDATDLMEVAAGSALEAARLHQEVIAINRAEYSVGVDPRPENRAATRKVIEERTKELSTHLAAVGKTQDEQAKKLLAAVKENWRKYQPEIEDTFKQAEAVKNFQMTAEMKRVRDSVESSRAAADNLRNAAKGVEERLNQQVTELSKAATEEYQRVSTLMMIVAAIGIVFGLCLGFLIAQYGIAKPIAGLVEEMKKLAAGNFNVSLPWLGRKDEVGEIADAIQTVVDKVGSTVSNIKVAANEVTGASAEISTATTDLSQRTEEQAASLEETSASMEEISSTVRKNAENARQANEFAVETNRVAERSGAVVNDAVGAMARIEDSSRKISEIIGVIDEIARQTNLLALNAAVEAARAGEAGRGFAVVASEVRTLAQRSSQAAKDIKDLITSSNSQVKDGVDLVNKAGESLNEIRTSIKKVADIVGDIANASMEQSTGVEQINKALAQMDEVTQQNSALVEENAATAKTLEHQARAMDTQVAYFQIAGHAAVHGGEPSEKPAARRNAAPHVAHIGKGASAPKAGAPAKPAKPVAAKSAAAHRGGPVGLMQGALAVAVNEEGEWSEF
jgi:methyl-accepting chemotaxis protein